MHALNIGTPEYTKQIPTDMRQINKTVIVEDFNIPHIQWIDQLGKKLIGQYWI